MFVCLFLHHTTTVTKFKMNLNVYLKFFLFSVKFVDKKSSLENQRGFLKKGGDILSHWLAVPSALAGLTSLFEMDRGEPRCNNHLKSVVTLT